MFSKSLLIFLGVGVASGFTLGIYLVEIKDGRQDAMMAIDGPSISILTTKPTYEVGEEVIFHIVNSGTIPLLSYDGSYGAAITGLSGMVIYEFTELDIVASSESSQIPLSLMPQKLWPGEKIAVSWDQIKHDGDMIQSGLYKMRVNAYADTDVDAADVDVYVDTDVATADIGAIAAVTAPTTTATKDESYSMSDVYYESVKDEELETVIKVEDSITITVR